jgi:ATP/maltotriose-dependent transcriptional regulator MalT
MPAAASLLQRAVGLRSPDDPERPLLNLLAGDALIELGEFAVAENRLLAAIEQFAEHDDHGGEMRARLSHLRLRYTSDPEASERTVLEEVERALPLLEGLGDDEGLARAWRLVLQVNFTRGQFGAAERAASRLIDHARRAGDPTLEARFLPSIASCVLYGPTPVAAAEERCRELLVMARTDRRTEAILHCVLAHLTAMRGRFDEARNGYRRSRAMLEELGWRFHAALTSIDSGAIEMLAGDPVAAESELRRDLNVLREMGERDYLPTTAALLSEALYRQGRHEEARELTVESESVAAPEDVASQSLWRSVRAKLLALRGRVEEAEALAKEAVRLIGETDNTEDLANALMDLAEVYTIAGRREEARAALASAEASFASKGDVVSSETARRRMAALAPVS